MPVRAKWDEILAWWKGTDEGYEYLPRIVTQTREQWDIPNSQPNEVTLQERNFYEAMLRRFASGHTQFRTGLIPVYNCHGLTFASKRTSVGPSALRKILRDDRYRRISDEATILPGDLVLYVGENGDIEHSGVIVESPSSELRVPRVLSKWGKGSEVVHWVGNCPYDSGRLEFYRIYE